MHAFYLGFSLSLGKKGTFTLIIFILYSVFTNVYVNKGIYNYYVLVTLCSTQVSQLFLRGVCTSARCL